MHTKLCILPTRAVAPFPSGHKTGRRSCSTWEDGECGYACSDHASWHEVGVPSSFPIESVGSRDPVTGEGCPGHTDDDRLVCVDFANIVDYARLAVAYVVELHDFFENPGAGAVQDEAARGK
jgi:hypothetical protein